MKSRFVIFLFAVFAAKSGAAQLTFHSSGNEVGSWRKAQLESLEEQLRKLQGKPGEMRKELTSQQEWLKAWSPGELSDEPSWKQAKSTRSALVEPAIDPNRRARQLRGRLLGPKARPTQGDTQALSELMRKFPQDVGVRQLHLHWLDQRQYRKDYAPDIAELAGVLDGLLQQFKQTKEVVSARAFCLYRRARALAYRELPDVISKHPIEDTESHSAALLGTYRELLGLVGEGRPEFVLLKIRLLRRDGWYGTALLILEEHGQTVDRQWYLKKRRDLLKELGWGAAFAESAEIYAQEFPEAVAAENKAP